MKKRLSTLICIFVLLSTLTAFAAACGDESFKINFYVGDTAYETVTTGGKEVITLPTDPAKEGYTFAGWFFDGSTTSQLTANTYAELKLKSEVNVYAKWTANDNTIIFDANGGSGAMENSVAKTDSVILLKANAFTRVGYTFAGWATTADGKVAYADGASYTMKVGGATLFAKWTGLNNTLAFDANDGSGTMPSRVVKTGDNVVLENQFLRKGYEFAGWATTATGEVIYKKGASYTMEFGGATLFAKWTANINTIIFYPNCGAMETASQTMMTDETAKLTANTFTRDGYTFAGWATTANGVTVDYTDGASYTMGATNVQLFAKWTANKNTLSFDANGGVGTMAGQKVKTGEMATMTANAFTRDGYNNGKR
ncbi:MAG: InlB B-repeat-containing protein [Clostridia bacterium]